MTEPSESTGNATFDEVVGTVEKVRSLLNGEQIKISEFRVYAELEHILYGMIAQKTFIDLIEFRQELGNDKIMHAVYIGRYSPPNVAGGSYFPKQGYWILYGRGMSYSDKDYEIRTLGELIRQNGIKIKRVKVENNALDEYWEKNGFIETEYGQSGQPPR